MDGTNAVDCGPHADKLWSKTNPSAVSRTHFWQEFALFLITRFSINDLSAIILL